MGSKAEFLDFTHKIYQPNVRLVGNFTGVKRYKSGGKNK